MNGLLGNFARKKGVYAKTDSFLEIILRTTGTPGNPVYELTIIPDNQRPA